MVEEWLEGIRCLYNTDECSVVEVKTDRATHIFRIPYKIFESQKGDRYEYAMGVRQICKTKGIIYRYYYGIYREGKEENEQRRTESN